MLNVFGQNIHTERLLLVVVVRIGKYLTCYTLPIKKNTFVFTNDLTCKSVFFFYLQRQDN